MPGWMNHKVESRLPGKISITSDIQMLLLLSHVWLCDPMHCSKLGFPVHHLPKLVKLMSIESISSSVIPFLLLPLVFPTIRVFSNELALRIRWPIYWSFSFSISLSSEYSGLISFRIDWFYLLAAQGTLKSLLQHHTLKAFILQHSVFFMVQLGLPWWLKQ